MKKYTFHWLDGSVESIVACGIVEAYTGLGYSQGALAALDWYEEEPVD